MPLRQLFFTSCFLLVDASLAFCPIVASFAKTTLKTEFSPVLLSASTLPTSSNLSSKNFPVLPKVYNQSSWPGHEDIKSDAPTPEVSTKIETLSPRTSIPQFKPSLHKWKTRLVTKEDPFGIHKISGIGQTITGGFIMACGLPSGFQEIPQFLEPWMYAFTLTVALQLATTFQIAASHRKNEHRVKITFMNMSVSCLAITFLTLWAAPFDTVSSFFDDNALIGQVIFTVLSSAGIALSLDGFFNFDEFKQGQIRRDKRADLTDMAKECRALIGIVPYLFTLPLNVFTLIIFGFLVDRPIYMDVMLSTTPGLYTMGENFYLGIFLCLGVSYLALFVTLRDKGLISFENYLLADILLAIPVLYGFVFRSYDPVLRLVQHLLL